MKLIWYHPQVTVTVMIDDNGIITVAVDPP